MTMMKSGAKGAPGVCGSHAKLRTSGSVTKKSGFSYKSRNFFPFLDELDKSKHFCRNFFFKIFFLRPKKFSRDLAEFSKLFFGQNFFFKNA